MPRCDLRATAAPGELGVDILAEQAERRTDRFGPTGPEHRCRNLVEQVQLACGSTFGAGHM